MIPNTTDIAVLLPVYHKDNAVYFRQAVDSIFNQTYCGWHLYIGIDGHVPNDLQILIDDYGKDERVTVLPFAENRGLAAVLNDMIAAAIKYPYRYFARMDADDISLPDRFRIQHDYLSEHPDIDALGGSISEIDEHSQEVGRVYTYPATPAECRRYFAFRNPLAHPSVMFNRKFVEAMPCMYDPNYRRRQDTMLWYNALKNNAQLANVQTVVLQYRMTQQFYQRTHDTLQIERNTLRLRKKINKDLQYGMIANIYAILIFIMHLSPIWLKRIAYRISAVKKK